jgi:endonuclease V-like protein UPF0215 family
MKEGIRTIGIASGPIGRKSTVVFGIIIRSGIIEGALSTRVDVNGCDGTRKILHMISRSRFKAQIKAIALNGIAIAGLNIIDVKKLEDKLGIRVFVITRKKPRVAKLVHALEKFSAANGLESGAQVKIIKDFSKNNPRRLGAFYVQGSSIDDAKNIAPMLFEAVRASHIIARAAAAGESKGRI